MLSFDVCCDTCGEALVAFNTKGEICVEPCKKCLNTARDEGYDEGRECGYNEGYDSCSREKGE